MEGNKEKLHDSVEYAMLYTAKDLLHLHRGYCPLY